MSFLRRRLAHARESDTDAAERRADLQHMSIGKRPRAGNLRTASAPPSSRRSAPSSRPAGHDVDESDADNGATIVQSAGTLANLRRRPTKPHGMSPDDTVRVDDDLSNRMREARRVRGGPRRGALIPAPRAPKMPSR